MPAVTFFHPDIKPSADGSRPGPYLTVRSGVDEVSWGYNLNTTTFPTYGGEVVQILSCYIDDLAIVGTLPTYRSAERIYSYFAYYLQIATQGRNTETQPGKTSYNQTPMKMTYPERGWSFDVMPTSLPGFRQSADTVAPQWRVVAHIVDHTMDAHSMQEFTKAHVLEKFLAQDKEDFQLQGRIGFSPENPFSGPGTFFGSDFDPEKTREAWLDTADRFNEIIDSYLDHDLEEVYESISSHPAWKDPKDKK